MVMRELGRLFKTLCSHKHTRCGKCTGDIKFFFNITTHFGTGFSPLELHFGVKPTDPIQSIVNFREMQPIMRDAKIVLTRERLTKSFMRRAIAQETSTLFLKN